MIRGWIGVRVVAALVGASAINVLPAVAVASDVSMPGSSLSDYLDAAQSSSPAIAAASARHGAALEKMGIVGGLPDPVLSYGHYFEEVETRVGPQVYRLGVRQRLPWFGKLSLAEDAAREHAAAAAERLRAARLDVAVAVTTAFAEYAYLARAMEITEEQLVLLQTLNAAVVADYSSGAALYGDVMKAQIGLARAEDSLASLNARRWAASSRLAAAVGLPIDGELPFPEAIPDPVPAERDLEAAAFEQQSPDLLALRYETEAARYDQSLSRRHYFPDLTVGVDYIATDEALMPVEDSGKDPLIGFASISVPLWFGKQAAAARQADAALEAGERATAQRALELVAELRMSEFELDDALRRVLLYEERLVPAAHQSVSSTDSAYRAGTADFDALVMAHEAALEFELAHARSRADALIASAKLARLAGADLWIESMRSESAEGEEVLRGESTER